MAVKHRFLVDKVTRGGFAFVEGREVYHARKVLRLKAGDRIILFDEEGNEYEAEMLRYHSKEKMEAKVLGELERDVEMTERIHLVLGLCRSRQFELALQKCTEIGVHSIIPLETDHSILKSEDAGKKIDRWEKIVLDATKQSARTHVPKVNFPQTLEALVQNFDITADNTLFASVSDNVVSLKDGVKKIGRADDIYVVIGPEGGFSPKEMKFAEEQNWNFVSLGKTVLRTETAAIFLTSILSYEFD